jgi:hypothetical protein
MFSRFWAKDDAYAAVAINCTSAVVDVNLETILFGVFPSDGLPRPFTLGMLAYAPLLPLGVTNFTCRAYDAAGNASPPVALTAVVCGEGFTFRLVGGGWECAGARELGKMTGMLRVGRGLGASGGLVGAGGGDPRSRGGGARRLQWAPASCCGGVSPRMPAHPAVPTHNADGAHQTTLRHPPPFPCFSPHPAQTRSARSST